MNIDLWICQDGQGGYDIGAGNATIAGVMSPGEIPESIRPPDYDPRTLALAFKAAPAMLAALEAGHPGGSHAIPWVHNAAITGDIEALRRICLAYARWNNEVILPAIAAAKGEAI